MTWLRVWLLRCAVAIGLKRGESRLQAEIQSHLDLLTDEHLARGLTPAEARAAARRDFGGVDQVTEHWRDQYGLPFIDGVRQDLRFAWRTLRRSPVFAGSAILTLGLGIGANTAIFSLIDALLLKALPVHAPDQLYRLSGNYAYASFRTLQSALDADTSLLATAAGETLQVSVDAAPERAQVAFVSGSYFPVLGVSAQLGRTLNAGDETDGAASPVTTLSDGFWRRRFAADPAVVGRILQIGGQPVTIIGVAPRGFFGERVGESPDIWAPLPIRSLVVRGRDLIRSRGTAWLDLIARLPPGADLTARQVELTHRYQQILTDVFGPHPADDERRDIAQVRVELLPAGAGLSPLRRRFAQPLWLLMAAVVVVLAIACANVANLLLARAATRQREIGLRLALGVSRGRLVRQLLTEALLLATLGATAGLLVAWAGQEVLLRLVSPDGVRIALVVTPDVRVLAFVAATTIGTAFTVALVPAWQAARVDVLTALRTGGRITGQGGMARAVLVVVQVALSLVLLVAAALFVRTLSNLRQVDLGFRTEQQIIADVNPVAAGYEGVRFGAYCAALLDRLRQEPRVADVSFSENGALMGRNSTTDRLGPSGREIPAGGLPKSSFDVVGPRYFRAMQIRLLEGRDFDDRDSANAEPVIAINESMARHFFGDASVVGRRLRWDNAEFTVVAVTADVRGQTPREAPLLQFYVPYFQHPERATLASVRVVIRTAGDAGSAMGPLRAAIQSLDPAVPLEGLDLTETLVDRTLAQTRMIASLATAFGLLALVVASIGLYGVIAFGVASRTSELGLRLALGATRGEVAWLLTKRHMALVGAGALIGLPLAIAGASFLDSQLFGVGPADPATAVVAAGILLGAAIASASVPTWRAARIQPVIALRHE